MYIDYQTSVLIGALGAGAIIGLIPLIVGIVKKKNGLAAAGFIACIIGSYLLGLFLSIPLCAIFTFVIVYSSKKETMGQKNEEDVSSSHSTGNNFCPNCGNIINENQTFCINCGKKLK